MGLPGIVVTGASGFIGRHFVIAVSKQFRLFCLARRTQKEAGVPRDENIRWVQIDISNRENLQDVSKYIIDRGGADYVLHLAGYYDFSQEENSAYEITNVTGTRNILELAETLRAKRFIFSSSLAACKFPPPDEMVTEESPADADFPYAISKRKGEVIIEEFSDRVPCAIIRLAAVFSDWCEYPPLYMLLKTWLSRRNLMSRILAGRGESAVPYIHIKDLIKLFLRIIEISASLPGFAIYNGTPYGSVSHHGLFKTATRYYYGRDIKPIFVPKPLATIGLIARSFVGRIVGHPPFEQPWMMEYVDKKLNADASITYRDLGWKPTPRYHILRRLLFLTEKMSNHPTNWAFRNETLLKRVAYRKSMAVYDILGELRETLIDEISRYVFHPKNESRFSTYQRMDQDLLRWYIALNYQLIAITVRNRDRALMQNYAQIIASRRFAEGFSADEVKDLMRMTGNAINKALFSRPELDHREHMTLDYINLTVQFAVDEIEDSYELLETHPPQLLPKVENLESLANCDDLKRIVRQLEDICSDSLETGLSRDILTPYSP